MPNVPAYQTETVRALRHMDAVRLYVNLVNDLLPEPFIARLAPDVRYNSHWVINELGDSAAVAELLRRRVRQASEQSVRELVAKIGVRTTLPVGEPLAILFDVQTDEPTATVTFDIADEKIKQISICVVAAFQPVLLDSPDEYEWPVSDYLSHHGQSQ